jgi:hypothetical protein
MTTPKRRHAPPVDAKKSLAAWEAFFASCRRSEKRTPLRESTYTPEPPTVAAPAPTNNQDRAAARRAAALKAVETRRRNAANKSKR